ncbi:hypothetical protein ADIAL_1262 [Alkalibacterium sp. AK22]|uniref:tetratricopeptide repeat protein n=1 Tax=Alkalibacterium sp. AK22 TaxID=1229520 RepID=UPI00044E2D80|nr:hypothetical protein [Alkalibacterium sp. AK22]EXJ23354.1 hypothetical protein ADIAL_1262 [Alkalibacterium sp. AK22]
MRKRWLLVFLLPFVLSGCSDNSEDTFNTHYQAGMDQLIAENYPGAEASFQEAREIRPDDTRIMNLMYQIEHYQNGVEFYDLNDYDSAIEQLNFVIDREDGSEEMVERAAELAVSAQATLEQLIMASRVEGALAESSSEALTDTEEPVRQDSIDSEGDNALTEQGASIDTSNDSTAVESKELVFEDFQGTYIMFYGEPFESRAYFIIEIADVEIREGFALSEYSTMIINDYWVDGDTLTVDATSYGFHGEPEDTDIHEYKVRMNDRKELYFDGADVTMYEVSDQELESILNL